MALCSEPQADWRWYWLMSTLFRHTMDERWPQAESKMQACDLKRDIFSWKRSVAEGQNTGQDVEVKRLSLLIHQHPVWLSRAWSLNVFISKAEVMVIVAYFKRLLSLIAKMFREHYQILRQNTSEKCKNFFYNCREENMLNPPRLQT